MAAEAAFDVREEASGPVLALSGDWTVDAVASLEHMFNRLETPLDGARVDVSALGRMDVAGAYMVVRAVGTAAPISLTGAHEVSARLFAAVQSSLQAKPEPREHPRGVRVALDKVGRHVALLGAEIIDTISFLGAMLAGAASVLARPNRIRWYSVVHVMEFAGLNAMPIIAVLSFFIGLVVAYLGARILGDFGASVFTVELVAFSVMREFGVVITAVLLAGRTDSAFTAEIGAMKMRQEIDAMRVIGIDPVEALVVPRLFAMLVMTPILTFAAILAGLFGGLLVCWAELGVSPQMFWTRIAEGIPAQHFWVGMVKSPIYAIVLAMIGCRHGLNVGGDVASLGKQTTAAVVQSIFLVIMLDAIFALWFLELDI